MIICYREFTVLSSYDAVLYARILGKRFPGTHNLHMIEEADHNFTEASALIYLSPATF